MPETSTDLSAAAVAAWRSAGGSEGRTVDDTDLGALIGRVQLDETLSQVSDVVLTVASDGTIGYVSPAIHALLGFDQEQLLGRHLVEFLHPDDADDVVARLDRGHGHHDVGARLLMRQEPDGWREVLLFVHAGPALDAVGYRAVVLRDAKDRGHTLDALRQRLAFEDLLTRVASSFIHRPAHEVDACITGALSDIGTFVGVDRVYVFVSRDDRGTMENTHEWTKAGVPSEMNRVPVVDPSLIPEWMGTLERLEPIYIPRVADQTDEWRHEIDLLKPQGVRSVLAVPLADEGHLIGFIGFDLVERERIWSDDHIAVLSSAAGIISQALARSDAEQRFGLAFTNAPLGMVLSAPDGRHIQVNQAYCDLVGLPEHELIGRPAIDLIYEGDADALTRTHRRVVLGQSDQESLEVRMLRGDDEMLWLRLHISGVRGGDGKLRYTVSHAEDITERHRQELELQASEQRYRTVVESSPAVIARFDRDHRVVYLSPAFELLTGMPVDQVVGHTANIFGVADEGQWRSALDRVFSSRERLDTEWEVPMPDGRVLWFQSRAVPELSEDGEVEHVLVMNTDITALKRTEAELAHQALHDPLTGLANRALLLDQLARILARRQRVAQAVALLFLDLDRFKVVNDSLGHIAGDQLLVQTAKRLASALRPTDTVARLGGDEFVVLIDDFTDPRDPIILAERIHQVLKAPVLVDGNEVFTTVSIGIAVANAPDDTAEGLLRDADAAMYLAKARGRDRYEIFDEDLRTQATERLRTESHLRRALEMGEIEVYYQPELALDTGIMVGAEALARWHHPVAGLLEAGAFIELAEDSGLIIELGEWVLTEACRQAGVWQRERPDFPLTIRVNLSARQIAQPDLVDQVVQALAGAGIDASALCLEITETALMSDPVAGLKVLQDLRSLGVELAIDDFGTGYSSLSYLKRFPVDVLKIDRSFVDGLGDDPDDTAIVTAIISLGRALGLRLVAEGVETRRQLDELRRLGCDRAQGFMFARPRPAALLWEARSPYPWAAICGEVGGRAVSPTEEAGPPAAAAGPFGNESKPLQLTWAHLEQLLLYVDEAIVCLDESGTVLFANAALARMTGHDPVTLVGASIADYVHPDDLGELLRLVDRWHAVAGMGGLDPQRIRAADGEWLRVTIDAVSAVGPLAVVATLRLAGVGTESEQELRHRLVEQGRLVRIASSFVHLPPGQVDDGVDAALAELGSMGGVDRVEIVLFSETGDTMNNTHEWVGPGVEPRRVAGAVPVGDVPFLQAIKANQEVHIPAVGDLGPGWEAERVWFGSRGANAALAVPLADQGRVIGFMGFEAAQSEWWFSVNHVMTLRSAAGILAQAFAKREAEARLAFQAGHDPLTGLPNRWSFLEALRAGVDELAEDGDGASVGRGDGTGLAVLLFDLDRFKVVNDSLGHRLGDQLLVILAQRMDAARPEGTVLARMGGDELVVMVKGLDAVGQAAAMADHLREVVRRPVMVEGHEMSTTASAGIAFTALADQSADDLLRHADAALYAAKEFGRDRVEVFDETLRAKVRRRLQNEIELRQALDHGQLVVHYQPEMEVPSGRMVAVEALVRWHHPERGLLAAAEFIDLAEETGLITELGLWVLREACSQQVRWLQEYPDHELRVRVNLSAVQLGQPDLLSQVVEIVHETGIAPGQLCLEITETVVMADAESSLALLEKLRGLGLELAIDDFGTGYSSLSYLKRLPVDVLKIDRSFVDGLGTDPDDTAIVGAVMVLASSLGLRVTAEGVENEVQLRELLRLGCERVQGYFFGRPQAPALIAERLAAVASQATRSEETPTQA